MDIHQETFKQEAYDLLAELEASLLELEETPDDMEVINRVFRAMHTVKGSGAMFGFDDIAEFTHEVETAFDHVREGKVKVSQELINVTLSARDQIMAMLNATDTGESVDELESKKIITSLQKLVSSGEIKYHGQKISDSSAQTENIPPTDGQEKVVTYRIYFEPVRDLFTNGTNPVPLLNELRELGECSVLALPDAIPDLVNYDPGSCYTAWDIVLTTDQGLNAIEDVFIFVEDDCKIDIQVIDAEKVFADPQTNVKKLGEILVDRGEVSPGDLQKSLAAQKRIGDVLTEANLVKKDVVSAALAEQEHLKRVQDKQRQKTITSSIRVDSGKLDVLVDLVGELVTVQARLSQKSSTVHDPELLVIAEEIERLTDDLRDNTMSIRMLPIGTTFNKFKRLVRDLSNDLGKQIVMTTEGAETELDKTVIDQLNDPLVHLIRNSIDHGIEKPDVRQDSGKPAEGTIHLSAEHSGGHVLIKISDDGGGLDPKALLAKAVSKGLVDADAKLSDQEIFSFLFAPGFSTAETITDVSGRGVGMDVVKRGIESLRGLIAISSQTGQGTTISIKLPLTLAIIDGLLVETAGEMFIIPQTAVLECFEQTLTDIENAHGNNVIRVNNKMVPYVCLRERFKLAGEVPPSRRVIMCEALGTKVGLAVDRVIGNYQIVIKPLGDIYKGVECISGATILGDGTVALILDPVKLMTGEQS